MSYRACHYPLYLQEMPPSNERRVPRLAVCGVLSPMISLDVRYVTCKKCLRHAAFRAAAVEQALSHPPCPSCKGTGRIRDPLPRNPKHPGLICTACNGSGKAAVWNRETGEAL